MTSRRRPAAIAALVGFLLLVVASTAHADRPLRLGIFDGLFRSADAGDRERWLDRTKADGGELVLSVVAWSSVAPSNPGADFDPRDPADPGYSWDTIDEFVTDSAERGLEPILTVTRAPRWAEGPNRPASADPGTWRPDAGGLRDFAEAIARRYSGSFVPAGASAPLPRVRNFQAWTEPNLSKHLAPQWKGRKAWSPKIYLGLLNGFFRGVTAVSGTNQVITAGTAPYGDDPGGERLRPLRFWREVLCVGGGRCKPKPHFDVLAHHPIGTSGPPRQSAIDPDDISTPDLGALRRVLRKAERSRNIVPGGRHPLWVTEFWWSSDPPDRRGYKPAIQARHIAESLYLFWKSGAEVAISLRIRDAKPSSSELPGSGLYYLNGEPKPAARAFSFPFAADPLGKGGGNRRIEFWGKAPAAGKVVVERKAGKGWKRAGSARAGKSRVFTGSVKRTGKLRLRARAGGETSLVWKVR